jgi:hypothetical protein
MRDESLLASVDVHKFVTIWRLANCEPIQARHSPWQAAFDLLICPPHDEWVKAPGGVPRNCEHWRGNQRWTTESIRVAEMDHLAPQAMADKEGGPP